MQYIKAEGGGKRKNSWPSVQRLLLELFILLYQSPSRCRAQRPTCFSEGRCNVMSDVHVQLPIENQNSEEENMPYLPLDQAVPTYVLGRRRHGISIGCESPYCSRPRMKRRGAVSYETSDTAAEYIRYLGDALSKRPINHRHLLNLPELPANKLVNLSMRPKSGRRGSFQQNTPSQHFKDLLKGSVLQRVGVEGHASIIQDKLENVDSWDFDVFAFRRTTEGRPLFHMGLHLLQKYNLIKTLKLDILKVMKFFALVEAGYHPDNCYHNCTHATDVTQALHCLISEPKLLSVLTPLELLASLLAAMCHDLDHPGVNQSFLLNTSSYLASIHGPHSLLEHHHCHAAKAILTETQLLDHFSPEDRQEVLSLMEDLILATDVNRHKDFMAQFEEMLVSSRGIDLAVTPQRHFVLMMAIKAADISNPSRCLHLSKLWSEHIMEEFFRQGDCERTLNLPISFLCDRYTTAIPKSQAGFFEFVALPLFKAWSKLFSSKHSLMYCKNIINNKAYWDEQTPRSNSSSDSEEDSS